jgi:hypothetical protein
LYYIHLIVYAQIGLTVVFQTKIPLCLETLYRRHIMNTDKTVLPPVLDMHFANGFLELERHPHNTSSITNISWLEEGRRKTSLSCV